jgi:hypothetical protein
MMRESSIAGQRFGRLIAIRRLPAGKQHIRWLFRCDCGRDVPMFKANVVTGNIHSCLECGHQMQAKAVTKHGRAHTSEYQSYHAARQRCLNPKDARYSDYGGRGIEFRFQSFEQFFAILGERPSGLLLERIDNNRHYEPGNVKWATRSAQQTNQRPRRTKSRKATRRKAELIAWIRAHLG